MEKIQDKFAVIEDPRHPSYVEHKLTDILTIVMCAVISGLDTLGDIVIYASNSRAFFKEHFHINWILSKATFARILSMIDGAQVGEVIIEIMKE